MIRARAGCTILLALAAGGARAANPVAEVLVLHHSHLDVGYTHTQPMLWELQKDFLYQALDMLDETAAWPERDQPRWTCEVTAPVRRWLGTASAADIGRFRKYLRQGRIGISAFEYNTTPLSSAEDLARQLYAARDIEQRFGIRIRTANQHDVTGIPWPAADLLRDSGVELLIMAVNLHLSGVPKPRPSIFRWRTPGGRELLVLNGEHYSMFDQWLQTVRNSLPLMQEGLQKYLANLEKTGYHHDFIVLSATCAPLAYDNSPPNTDLPALVRAWNEAGRRPRIRFVTPEQILARIRQIPTDALPVVSGDWTDFWNFGAASSARETRIARNASATLAAIDLLRAFGKPDTRTAGIAARASDAVLLYNEHTWGASNSLDHDAPNVTAQWLLKAHSAGEAQSLADYLLVRQLQDLARNPRAFSKQDGVLVVNPCGTPVRYRVPVPDSWLREGKRIETRLMHRDRDGGGKLSEPLDLPPFSWKIIPFARLRFGSAELSVRHGNGYLESPFYRLEFDPGTGRVISLHDKRLGWEVLDRTSPWGFFQFVHEKPDPAVDGSRKAFHVRSVENERIGLTGWRPQWKAVYSGYTEPVACTVEQSGAGPSLVIRSAAEGAPEIEQRITLRADSPLIDLKARIRKADVRSPEAIYFAFPLSFAAGWRSHFDTAGLPVELDREQIEGACRDWVTVDTHVSVHRGDRSVTLYCPDAPLVQVGGFNFGRNQAKIPRAENPVLLAWPLNNYWETNFRSSQPGTVEIRYTFVSGGAYDAVAALQTGQAVMLPPLVHPVSEAKGGTEGRFLELSPPGVLALHVKPAADGKGVVLRLMNHRAAAVKGIVKLPGGSIGQAWRTSPAEENLEALPVGSSGAAVLLGPRAITTIRLCHEANP